MRNPKLAARYAKSLLEVAKEQDALDAVYGDMLYVKEVCKQSKEFAGLLSSPIIGDEKKSSVVHAVLDGKVNKLSGLFLDLLIKKNRSANVVEIVDAFIDQYYAHKGIQKIKITTATQLSPEQEQNLIDKVKAAMPHMNHFDVEKSIDESLIGGFTMQVGNTLVDASILRDLKDIQKQFYNNDYLHALR